MKFVNGGAVAPLALAAVLACGPALAQEDRSTQPTLIGGPVPTTGNTSSVSNWRLDPTATFNGVASAFNGTALLLWTTSAAAGTYACSGSLVAADWILTAGHCTDGLLSMSVQFGWYAGAALQTRSAAFAVQNPNWDGTLDTGADLALVKLNAPVSGLHIYSLSTTKDVGKQFIMTGYGTSGVGSSTSNPSWADSNYGHYGYNTFDTTSVQFETAWDALSGEGVAPTTVFADTYVADFDYSIGTAAQKSQYNTLGRLATLTGGAWTSDDGTALGATEALIAGGDSGGGDFVWDAASGQWLLSAVHSWGWQFCGGRITTPNSCDFSTGNSSSYGDLMGSTAVYQQLGWINSVIGVVPEPGTYGMMALGLAVVGLLVRRRRA